MEKYGFVYLWYDRKYKRFYIGCHWGTIDDGYICSSKWMNDSYKRRPQDFKRRILSKVYTNRKDLLKEEHRFLLMIKDEELRKRYYNLSKKHFGHWLTDKDKSINIKQKISVSVKKLWSDLNYRKIQSDNKKGPRSPLPIEIKIKISKSKMGHPVSLETREKLKKAATEQWKNPEYQMKYGTKKTKKRNKSSPMIKGEDGKYYFTEDQKQKISNSVKELWKNPEYRLKNINSSKGKKWSEEQKKKISIVRKGLKRYNNRIINITCAEGNQPTGFIHGMIKRKNK